MSVLHLSQTVCVLQASLLSASNLGIILDEHLSFSNQISALSKSYYSHIRQLRCIRPYVAFKTASTIATSIVHSKLEYCNSLYHDLPKSLTHSQAPVSVSSYSSFLPSSLSALSPFISPSLFRSKLTTYIACHLKMRGHRGDWKIDRLRQGRRSMAIDS